MYKYNCINENHISLPQPMLKSLLSINKKYLVKNKKQLEKLKHLISLPYNKLIDELIFQVKNKNQIGIIPKSWILKLCVHHDCRKLYQVYQCINNYNKHQITNTSQLCQQWEIINQCGLSTFLSFNTSPKTIQALRSSPIKKVISDYFTNIEQQIKHPLLQQIMKIISTGLPNYFPISLLSFQQTQKLKQLYLINLEHMLSHIYSGNQIEDKWEEIYIHKLLPMELFNISDQPLIQDLHYKYLCCNLSFNNRLDIGYSVAWLSRFGLPCHSYLVNALNYLKQHVSKIEKCRKQQKVIQSIYINNILYVMLRKIIGYNLDKTSQILQQNIIINKIIQLISSLPVTKIIIEERQNNSTAIKQIYDIFKNCVDEQVNNNNNKTKQLFEIYQIGEINQNLNMDNNDNVTTFVEVLLSRYLLSLFYCFRTNKTHQNRIKQLFSHPIMIVCLQNSLLIGDMLAQIIYIEQISQHYTSSSLFSNPNFIKKLQAMERQLKAFIDKLKTKDKQPISNINNIMSRAQNLQYLLAGHSQLTFDAISVLNRNKIQQYQQKIMISLLNDNQFIGIHIGESMQQLLKKKIQQKPSLYVNKLQQSRYPYLPTLSIKHMSQIQKYIYIKTSFCKHIRINFNQPYVVINIADSNQIYQAVLYFQKSFN